MKDILKIASGPYQNTSYHLFDKLLEIGVTQVIEKWHGLLEVELIFSGEFTDEDAAMCIYCHSPAMYYHMGDTSVTIEVRGHTFTTRFTRAAIGLTMLYSTQEDGYGEEH